jgi:glycosyltransferase involved in cell wall biosynthesis
VLFPADPANPLKRYSLVEGAVDLLRQEGRRVELHALHGVPNADVPLWMNASDAVVLASAREGSPNVVKESLACNVPVVSVDVGDVRERLRGVDGCYIAEATPEDIAAKLRLVLEEGSRPDAAASVAELSLERVAERLVETYRRVVERRTEAGSGPARVT